MTISDCCVPQSSPTQARCPTCGSSGKSVPLVTLKALLTPVALATLDPGEVYRFCPDMACEVVYFSSTATYGQVDVKVPVFQKDERGTTPICYCFGHTHADLEQAHQNSQGEAIPQSIQAHIRAGRCGCEVNNPQGSCCLGNVNRTLAVLREARHA